jgi:cysteinyl-tRNA synthetase
VLGLILSQRPNISEEQQILIKERQEARDDQNWEISDRLRNKLAGQGIEIKDTPRGQIWNRL